MNWRYIAAGIAIGGAAAYFRMKSAPTAHTAQAPGFRGAV